MLVGFICPNGDEVNVDQCLKGCIQVERCMTLPTLVAISREREWHGKASTTQLLNGTMLEFLKLTKDYVVDPDKRAFMLAGTKHHSQLDSIAKDLEIPSEIALSGDMDIFDLLEWEGDRLVLTDYKNWGSFKVAKALGLVEVGKEPDPSGAVYKVSGKWGKAGSPKMVPVWGRSENLADHWEQDFQLNRYRVMLKKLLRIIVTKLQLQVTVRDGGLYVAKERGVMRNIYRIPIPLLPDSEVESYFDFKNSCLMEAMDKGQWEIPCSAKESWDGVRCESFCEVWEHCPKGRLINGIGG